MPQSPRNPLALADWWKVFAMGTVLAGLIFLTFFYDYGPTIPLGEGPPVERTRVQTPVLDLAQLALARDGTRAERLIIEPKPLAHLLEKSIDIVPRVAKALGMPEHPLLIEDVRANPASHRGQYLWYKGKLRYLSRGKAGHPRRGYKIYEGWLTTDEGDDVLFRVSLEPRDIRVGEYVRIEGFFMKLYDSNDLPRADRVPVIVGPELFSDFPNWNPVAEVDEKILDSVQDDIYDAFGNPIVDGPVWDGLLESQYLPLWHMASHALTRTPTLTRRQWRKTRPFNTKEQLDKVKHGEFARGTPVRLLGSFVKGHEWEARPNPVGIKTWAQVWMQVRDLGGKALPVWIPNPIGKISYNQSLEVKAYYFRRMMFESPDGGRFTPVFVADELHRYTPDPPHPTTAIVQWSFVGLIAAVVLLFVFLARRDRQRNRVHLVEMDERRRRRRERATLASEQA